MKKSSIAKNKTALITGASKRIGRAIALAFADSGHNIIIHYRSSKKEAEKLQSEIIKKNVAAWTLAADLGKSEENESLIRRAFALGRGLCVLINNASIFPQSFALSLTLEEFNAAMLVNAWSPFCLSRAFAAKVKRGAIVNILDARVPALDPKHVAYNLSKHMLAAMTQLCAREFAPHITVNGVSPGLILPPPGETTAYLEKLKNMVPLCAYGKPGDIAQTVLFLAQSPFITGEIIYVDGGRQALRKY